MKKIKKGKLNFKKKKKKNKRRHEPTNFDRKIKQIKLNDCR